MSRALTQAAAALAALAAAAASPASAAIIFQDDFERPASAVVGAPDAFPTEIWEERERDDRDVRTTGTVLYLREDGSRASLELSTLGYENIVLTYEWRPLSQFSTRRDVFLVGATGGGMAHRLNTRGGTVATPLSALADNLEVFNLSFRIRIVDQPGNRVEGVRIYGVTLSGDPISSTVPEPATWAMMLVGFGGLGALARLRRSSGPAETVNH